MKTGEIHEIILMQDNKTRYIEEGNYKWVGSSRKSHLCTIATRVMETPSFLHVHITSLCVCGVHSCKL